MKYTYYFLALFFTITCKILVQAQEQTYDLDQVYDIPSNGILELRTNDAEITIIGSDREDVHLVVHREAVVKNFIRKGNPSFEIEVEQRGDRLRIVERRESNAVVGFYNEKNYVITLEVPIDIHLALHGDDDDYLVQNIGGKIYLNAEDGDAQFENCMGDEFTFYMDDGTVFLDQGRGELHARGEDGEFIIEKGDFYVIDVKVDDGDVRVMSRIHDRGEYEMYTEDGSIDFQILEGGGKIKVRHSDGRIRADRQFEFIRDEDHESILAIPGGDARMYIRTDDGTIRLSHMNSRY